MTFAQQTAKQFRDLLCGGNWTGVNLKDTLAGIDWQQATKKVHSFNTIAVLLFHINYYIEIVIKVLEGGPLEGSDKLSFNIAPITSQQDWENLLDKFWKEAETFASLTEKLTDEEMMGDFAGGKYGNYYRNISGVIQHTHYHLGQISLIKKLLSESI